MRLPFLADDLFIDFDDDRACGGSEVLAEPARTTQVLFFTHHAHLAGIACGVVGADVHLGCASGSPPTDTRRRIPPGSIG